MFRCQFRSKTPRPKSTARYLLLAFACGVLLSFAVRSAPAQQLRQIRLMVSATAGS